MRWPLACCCAPAPGDRATQVASDGPTWPGPVSPTQQSVVPASNACKAVAGGAAGQPTPSTAGIPAVPKLAGGGEAQLKARDEDLISLASTHSAKSSHSLGMSSVGSELIRERMPERQRETERIQQAVKSFVRTMVRGQDMGAISPDGELLTCNCSLDKKLKFFIIELKGSRRRIALSEINEVFQGTEPDEIDTPLDELCATLELESGECLSFGFPDVPSRENFAICLQVLVDGQQ
eukprot:CAMPEP_0172719122 /NCGR_PEP_ID=MMETSP1074-20121228/75323_1 /TAXON_ID=2916 /ORGANISM="Ceratium fusus, Strain PA161109" /LENGTH=235 /DNA_ID=CAMNT_0013544441 /DNA_START=74 /DNA_END=781 /DNA_ORIENTATION=+